MSVLVPLPFGALVTRAFAELERNQSIFGLPSRKFALEGARLDTSVDLHGRRVAAPLGPSAGPHTQMAQNIVLCWLGGSRVIELKTVQLLDSLRIPRPCIETHDYALNVEWSQELSIEQSLEEYVRASMLIDMLAQHFGVEERPLFDLSVGYDLAGITSERMTGFMRGLMDARESVERLRGEIPSTLAHLRNLDFTTRISSSVTLSTFHGCPVTEIEQIADFLMARMGLDCTIKLNPTLLGAPAVHELLHDVLGYRDLHVPPSAFENDPSWDEAVAFIDRLQRRARSLGRSFAVKLTNTLIVENRSEFLPRSEKLAYLSGPPLHVIAMHLLRRIRRVFGVSLPISFSAGIERSNYPDAVSLGIAPVTVCTDLLKQGGYGRLAAYGAELRERMQAVGAASIPDFIRRARGRLAGSLADAIMWNTEDYVQSLQRSARYRERQIAHAPRKPSTPLSMFDCAACDLCVGVCPNAAMFELPSLDGALSLTARRQYAVFADWCNDCGNCELFCPDRGAPNRTKPRLFVDEQRWRNDAPRDAFLLQPGRVRARIDGTEYSLDQLPRDSAAFASMDYVQRATAARSRMNPVNSLFPEEP